MSAFHRPPEWQQSADRHTQLIDPVLTVRQLSRFELSLKSTVRIDHALVFATAKGGYEAYLPPRRPTRSDIAARHYTAVYEVDMGVHPFSGTLTLPSDNDAFEFSAELDMSWQVVDPARFVGSGHRDVPGLLIGELQRAARPVSRRFQIADSAAAEGELLQAINVLGPLGAPAGLQTTWTLRLRRDQENIDHQRRLQAIDHSATEQVRVAQRGSEIDVEVDRRNRAQDALQIERSMSYGAQQQHLALQQQRWDYEQAALQSSQQHQLSIQQGHQELELQQIEAQKIAFYQYHLQQGGVQAWALHLSQHPEDSRMVMTSMREDQLRMIQAQMDLVKDLLHGDTAEKFELEGPKQLALRTVSDILNQRLPGVPQTPPPLPGDPYAEYGQGAPEVPAQPGYGQAVPGVPAQPGFVPGRPGLDPSYAQPGHPGSGPADQPPTGASQTQPQPPAQAPAGRPTTSPYPGAPQPPASAPGSAGPYGAAPAYGGAPGPTGFPAYSPPSPPPYQQPYSAPQTPGAYGTPAAPAWQPPPGYGSTPTLPDQQNAAAATDEPAAGPEDPAKEDRTGSGT
ncbi:hypothetical protein ACOT81_18225 [Streptomyces sp. WI04-05B]|uniref:hypothetical protein n=1 Tax=Streptomyces TaxID=1883 RepID=UPI0029B8560D|nr:MULTISPECIES: hypothetical protein [unclassified Streptomyces]MDX2542676.1 hypothetical protein [Streptomyces sp. WI04-05B]MDX2582305.1 hypothetical protein [Streptomyces sp. WI04-05A]MDX3747718.1 hypothetical protein [Streptomyces sp. AK08-02]